MILHTGGRSLGATSTRSRPASREASRALLVGMTPSMAPSALITRTGEMRICSFTLKPRSIGPIASSPGTNTLAKTRLGGSEPEEDMASGHRPSRTGSHAPPATLGRCEHRLSCTILAPCCQDIMTIVESIHPGFLPQKERRSPKVSIMKPIECIVETAVYCDDMDTAEAFYREVLG